MGKNDYQFHKIFKRNNCYWFGFMENDNMKKIAIIIIALMLITIGCLSGCTTKTPVSEGDVEINIKDVIVTNQLVGESSFSNETTLEISNTSNFVIVTLEIINNEDKWLTVQASFQSLTDDQGNKYNSESFVVDINSSTYTLENLALIEDGEALEISDDIEPQSMVTKKVVYEIPIERQPDKLKVSYGLKANELSNVERWHHSNLDIST